MVELQIHMVLLWADTPDRTKMVHKFGISSLNTFGDAQGGINLYLPSLISMVMERDTTSLEARSLALGA